MAATRDEDGLPNGPGANDNGPHDGAAEEEPPAPPPPRPDSAGTPLQQAQRILGVDPARLARKLVKAREQKGWTRTRLAQEASLAPSTVSNLERQKSETPDPVVVLALAIALGYRSVAEMLGDESPNRKRGADYGPGPMSLAGLIEGLLRGVWAAQDARPPQTHTEAKQATLEEYAAQAGEVLRGARGANHPILAVGVVVLNEPRTLG